MMECDLLQMRQHVETRAGVQTQARPRGNPGPHEEDKKVWGERESGRDPSVVNCESRYLNRLANTAYSGKISETKVETCKFYSFFNLTGIATAVSHK